MLENTVDAFLSIKTKEELARFLNVKIANLSYYCRADTPAQAYSSFLIAKNNGSSRTIYAPNKTLKYIQRQLNQVFSLIYKPKRIAMGFVQGRSVLTNAKVHSNKKCVLNIDLKDFFDGIHFGRILGLFKSFPFCFDHDIAKMLAQLVCFNGKLPQGAPTSPILSNFICRRLDNDLIKMCSYYKIVCTRYCDDITISTKSKHLPTDVIYNSDGLVVGKALAAIIAQNNFSINGEKLRLQYNNSRQMVTGLVVNVKPNILLKRYKLFRAKLYYTYMNGVQKAAIRNGFFDSVGKPDENKFINYLKGTINYYKMILSEHSSRYQYLANKYNDITQTTTFKIPDTIDTLIANSVFITEHDEGQGTAFYVENVGLVTCLHNFWKDKKKAVVKEELIDIISRTKIYLPSNSNYTYIVSMKELFESDDLIVLDINYPKGKNGFTLASKNISFKPGRSRYSAIGYPSFGGNDSASVVNDILITQQRCTLEQTLLVVDKPFYFGASGGPVLDQRNKVVGYITRGNDIEGVQSGMSTFSPIKPLIK